MQWPALSHQHSPPLYISPVAPKHWKFKKINKNDDWSLGGMNPLGPKTPVSKPLRPREPIIYLTCLGGCGAPEPVSQDVMDHRTFCLSCFLLIASLIPPPSPFSFLLPVSPSLPISPSPRYSFTQLGPALPSSPIVFPSWQFPPHTRSWPALYLCCLK